jgi:hypothetical protein
MKKTKLFWLITGLLFIVNVLIFLFAKGFALTLLTDLLPIMASLLAIVGVFYAFKSFTTYDYAKTAWLFLLIGALFNFVAETIYGILEVGLSVDMNENFPSFADYFWFSGYFGYFLGLFFMLTGYIKSGYPIGSLKKLVSWAILYAVVAAAIIYFILVPIVSDTEVSAMTKIASLFYPIADAFVVSIAGILLIIIGQFGGGKVIYPWRMLGIAFVLFTVSDLLYS